MTFTLITAVAALLAMGDPNRLSEEAMPVPPMTDTTPLARRALETPAAEVRLGDRAPNFSYESSDGRWRTLDDLLDQGPILLAFGADELTLRVLEHERGHLMDLGVLPVAVVDSRAGAARAMVQRLGLGFTVLADRHGTIASQFNATQPSTGRQIPTWFVLDTKRLVRGLGRRGLPLRGYPSLAANALGLPAAGAALPASR